MYGNGVSPSDAVKLHKACQATNVSLRNIVETKMYG